MKQVVIFCLTMFVVALTIAVCLIAFDWAMSPGPNRVCDTMVSANTCEVSP